MVAGPPSLRPGGEKVGKVEAELLKVLRLISGPGQSSRASRSS